MRPVLARLARLFSPGVMSVYIWRRVLVGTCSIALTMSAILLLVQVLNNVGLLATSRNVLATTIKFMLLLTPSLVMVILPFATLIATFRTFERMNEDSELVVLASAGRSAGQSIRPAMMAAALLAVSCLAIGTLVEPHTDKLATEIIARVRGEIIRQAAYSGGFRKVADNLVVRIGGISADDLLDDVLVVDTRNRNTQTIYSARRGRLSDDPGAGNQIILTDGELLVRNRADRYPSRIQFTSYLLSLDSSAPPDAGASVHPKHRSTSELIAACKNLCMFGGDRHLAIELNGRLSNWIYVLAFAALAAWFSSKPRSTRTNKMRTEIVSLVILGLSIRGIGFLALNRSGDSALAAAAIYLIPFAVVATFIALPYARRFSTSDRSLVSWRLESIAAFVRGKSVSLFQAISTDARVRSR